MRRYPTSAIKLFEEGATKQTTEMAVRAQEESEMIKPTWRNVDTSVKSLLHRKDAELLVPSRDILEADMVELIKEARSKIKPVINAMSKEELNKLVISLEDAK